MRILLLLILFLARATYTGNMKYVVLWDYSRGISCQYRAPNMMVFWRTFKAYSCPQYIDLP
jgi:hypothetical protein